jgi:hypothetical protein
MSEEQEEPAAISVAVDELYQAEPADFVAVRTRLASEARKSGDADVAKRIGSLRKPTVPAWIVNRHVLTHPETVQQLLDIHEQLQAAHDQFDAGALRELTEQRRQAVDDLTRAALADAGHTDPPTSLREDVFATFDAAVADPEVAGRLGRLLRAEHWSGFGVASGALPSGAPAVRLLRGAAKGSNTPPKRPAAPKPATTGPQRDDGQRRVRSARKDLAQAEAELQAAGSTETAARQRVRELTDQLTRLQRELDEAKARADEARRAAKAARSRHRSAQAALDRAQRAAAT